MTEKDTVGTTARRSPRAEALDSIKRVLTNRGLRRIQLAFVGSLLGDWAYGTAVTVWAYGQGGATAVGLYVGLRFISAAVAGPFGAVIADHVPRKTFMMTTDAIRACLVAAAAISIGLDLAPGVVYVLAIAAAAVGAPFRSAQAGLVPQLVSRPDELTASNAVAANLENIVTFLGPALGASMLLLVDIQYVLWFNVATFLWSLAMVAGIRVPKREKVDVTSDEDENEPSFLGEMTAGFTVVARSADLRNVALLAASQGLIWGTLTVYLVVLAVRVLDVGASGVGYLDAVMGVSTVVGGVVVLSRITRGRLATDMSVGVLGWSLPLLLIAAYPSPVTVILALVVIGLMDPWVNVGLETIPQRVAPERVISRVYAVVEAALIGAMAVGAFVAPLVLSLLGLRGAFALFGVLVTAYVLATLGAMRRLDGRLTEPEGLDLLRSISIFAPLDPTTLETLAHRLEVRTIAAGGEILRMGETSDCFFVIRSGRVEVSQGDRVLRTEGAGEFFGEIGLLRDVPRTASVTAVTATDLLVLDRADFLEAVAGASESRRVADLVVSNRLGV